jgi:3-phenylpropionate/trans-cinnamate dioxygenase alpha subunit
MFPNLGLLPINQSLRIWQPKGPDAMEVWAWTLVDRDAPEAIKEQARRQTQFTFGSSGVFEQDDAENWAEIQRSFNGPVARRTPMNNQVGLGQSNDPDGLYPGQTDYVMSESAARGFYRRWRDLMMAD